MGSKVMYREATKKFLESEGPKDTHQILEHLETIFRGRRSVGGPQNVAQICNTTKEIVKVGEVLRSTTIVGYNCNYVSLWEVRQSE